MRPKKSGPDYTHGIRSSRHTHPAIFQKLGLVATCPAGWFRVMLSNDKAPVGFPPGLQRQQSIENYCHEQCKGTAFSDAAKPFRWLRVCYSSNILVFRSFVLVDGCVIACAHHAGSPFVSSLFLYVASCPQIVNVCLFLVCFLIHC